MALSVVMHGALLALRLPTPPSRPLSHGAERDERLTVSLAPPAAPRRATPSAPPPVRKQDERRVQRPKPSAPKTLTSPVQAAPEPAPAPPPAAEVEARREALARFLDEIRPAEPPAPDLAQRALAMARGLARSDPREAPEDLRDAPFRTPRSTRQDSGIDPLALELYFEAFVQKLNRSAAFVAADARERGAQVAIVQVELGADGSLRRYRILRAADQQIEIEYVRRVVERAAPFAAFPPDIRRRGDSLTFEICILPPRAGSNGGFSRTFGGRSCHDLG